jgi:hypothetical protein
MIQHSLSFVLAVISLTETGIIGGEREGRKDEKVRSGKRLLELCR